MVLVVVTQKEERENDLAEMYNFLSEKNVAIRTFCLVIMAMVMMIAGPWLA